MDPHNLDPFDDYPMTTQEAVAFLIATLPDGENDRPDVPANRVQDAIRSLTPLVQSLDGLLQRTRVAALDKAIQTVSSCLDGHTGSVLGLARQYERYLLTGHDVPASSDQTDDRRTALDTWVETGT